MTTLQYSVESLFSRTAYGIKPGLDVMAALLEQLGNPHHSFKSVHVAGTNGKGSVCAIMESVLRASGKKTGLYTSPHLFRFNERFRVNGKEISDGELESLIHDIEEVEKKIDSRPATFFEMSTAIAFEYFKRCGVEYAVVETGMGGRWDATNLISPVISVITRIAVDHTGYLGDDLQKIAWEKAGIIKEKTPVICGLMPVEAETVVYKEAAEKNAPILGSEEAAFIDVFESRRTDHLVNIEASGRSYHNIRFPLGGSYQLENCSVAVAALEDLSDIEGVTLKMKKGLEFVKWSGRFQMLSMKPPVLFDGAHNLNAVEALRGTLDDIFPGFEKGVVFGFMKDKDVTGMLNAFAPSVGKSWAVTLSGDRAMCAEEIAGIGRNAGMEIEPITSGQTALKWVESGKKRLLCFTGSLFMAEEIRKSRIQV